MSCPFNTFEKEEDEVNTSAQSCPYVKSNQDDDDVENTGAQTCPFVRIQPAQMCGFAEAEAATDSEQEILDSVRQAVELKFGEVFAKFYALSYILHNESGTIIIVANLGRELMHVKIHIHSNKEIPPALIDAHRGLHIATPLLPF
jgi:hypothetical protein